MRTARSTGRYLHLAVAWLVLQFPACTEAQPDWATLTFSYRRAVCDRQCAGTQIIRVSEEYWGGWHPTADMSMIFNYAGMALYSPNSDYGPPFTLDQDPLWGISDPACAGEKDLEGAFFDWPPV